MPTLTTHHSPSTTLQSSHPDVYAVGDVAAFPLQLTGGAIVRQEHVTACRQLAAHAAAELLGESKPFDYQPFFYSRVFNLSWQVRWDPGLWDSQRSARVLKRGCRELPEQHWGPV